MSAEHKPHKRLLCWLGFHDFRVIRRVQWFTWVKCRRCRKKGWVSNCV